MADWWEEARVLKSWWLEAWPKVLEAVTRESWEEARFFFPSSPDSGGGSGGGAGGAVAQVVQAVETLVQNTGRNCVMLLGWRWRSNIGPAPALVNPWLAPGLPLRALAAVAVTSCSAGVLGAVGAVVQTVMHVLTDGVMQEATFQSYR